MQEMKESSTQEDGSKDIFENLITADLSVITLERLMEIYNDASKVQQEKKREEEEKKKKLNLLKEKYKGVRISLGVPWVSVDIVNDFVNELLELKGYMQDLVSYDEGLGRWSVYKCKNLNSLNVHTYGTSRYPALRIIEATLNMREIIVKDGSFFNENETVAATEKQRLITEKFNKWVWEREERILTILTEYNKMFSDIKINKGENIKLYLEGKSSNIKLYDYQEAAIRRIIANKNTLLAFEVGTGKTYIMIASAMEMRAKGISRKNMFVVPNNIVSQWQEMFLKLYPQAKLLIIEPKSFVPKLRKKTLQKIKDEDFDGIIIAYSCFSQIQVSLNYQTLFLQNRLEKVNDAIKNPKFYVGSLYTERDRILKNINETKYNYKENDCLTFDELQINTLFVDEAHNFKNVPIETNLIDIRGINAVGSTKCRDMLTKVRIVQMQNDGRGIVFATGTPLSNSISDAYIMQNYLQIDRLEKCRLDIFDNWVKTFALVETTLEVAVDSHNFRTNRRFTKFFNLPELSRMFAEVAVFHSNEESGLPEKYQYVDYQINGSNEFKKYMHLICGRAERVKTGIVSPTQDNMLKISTDGRKSALDLELVNTLQPYDNTSKVYNCVINVFDLYTKYPNTSQIIFCDYSTPKGCGFSIYKKLQEKLIELGVDAKEIAFIHNAKTEISKQKLFEDVNSGKIRILVGSTCKLGIGANVQTRLKAIHHLDVPWRPADMVQREGRLLRQGNLNKEVYIFRYILEGSFDAYSWQILETKQTFISQFLSNTSREREMSDLEENVLNYAEVKALALSEPLMKILVAKENELKSAQIIQMKNQESKEMLGQKIELNAVKIKNLEEYIQLCNSLKLDIETYDIKMIKECLAANIEYLSLGKISIEPGVELFKIFDFSVIAPIDFNQDKPIIILTKDDIKFELELGTSSVGNSTRILHLFSKFEEFVAKQIINLEQLKELQFQSKQQYKDIDTSDVKIKKLMSERDEIKYKIYLKSMGL